jgi:hypothetical protein
MIDQWYGNAPFDPVAYGAVPIRSDHQAIISLAARIWNGRDYRTNSVRMEQHRLFELFRKQWSHHLIQADVDALIADNRLYDLTHTFIAGQGWKPIVPAPAITAEMVNDWSLRSPMGHDSINMSVCVRARCKREGVPYECQTCGGTTYDPTLIYEPLTSAGWDAVFQKIATRKAPGSRTAQDKYFLPNRMIAEGNKLAIYTGYASIASTLGKIFEPNAFWNPGTNPL